MAIPSLKIGDFVYKYVTCGGVFKYEVVGIHTYKDMEQYHVKCLSCNDHTYCELLIGFTGKDLRFFSCLNNRGDDYGEDDQRHWHDSTYPFFTTIEEAKLNAITVNKKCLKEDIEERSEIVTRLKKKLSEYEQEEKDLKLLIKEFKEK